MSLLTWKEYQSGKRIEEPEIKTEIPVPELPNLEVDIEIPSPETSDSKVDLLNGMSVEQLQEIKGIGPKTAEKIAAGQPYEKLDDLAEMISNPLYGRVCEKLSDNN